MKPTHDELEKKYPKGSIVSGHVHRLLRYGVEITLEGGAEGIIRNRELLWGREPHDPFEVLKYDQPVNALVIGLDRERERLELSLRQVEKDPWKDIDQRYRVGQILRLRVLHLRRSGAFVEIEPAVDGLIPLQEVCASPPEHIDHVLWVGDTVEAVITGLNPRERMVELSIKERLERLQDGRAAFMRQRTATQASQPLFDALRPEDRQRLAQWLAQHRSEEAGTEVSQQDLLVQRFPKLLIAEDDPSFRISLARLLRRLGHQVEVAESPEKAVAKSSADRYDLILIDLGFSDSEMDGSEATKRILALSPATPVVIITGVDWLERHTNAINEARQAGARSTLVKPVALHQLYDVMHLISTNRDAWNVAQIPSDLAQAPLAFAADGLGTTGLHKDLDRLVGRKLEQLQQDTGAAACVLFRMEPTTSAVDISAHSGAPLNQEALGKHNLQATPIDEVTRHNVRVYDPDTTRNPLKYRHLKLFDFSSCIGVPVESAGKTEYGLFLFHSQRDYFTPSHLEQATIAAKLLGAIIVQVQAERIIQRMQPYIFIGQLGSSLMHELNNRLGTVLNDVETLGRNYNRIVREPRAALDPIWRDEVGTCINEIQDRGKSIDEIAKLYLGLVGTEKHEPVNVNDLIEKAIRFLYHYAEGQRVTITSVLAPDLPATMTIAMRLEQVFLNIMLNAIQQTYFAKGGGELVVETSFKNSDLPIRVRFMDTGPGIHFQHQERIFDLGFSTRPDGTGIGLFVAESMMESLGGRIKVEESVMLLGTTFLVELPVVIPSIQEGTRW